MEIECVEECRFSPDTCCTYEKCAMWENCRVKDDSLALAKVVIKERQESGKDITSSCIEKALGISEDKAEDILYELGWQPNSRSITGV